MTRKKHHYVPVTYLEGFTGVDGFLWVGRKDDPENPLRMKPKETAFRNYYYSQPLPDGDYDNDQLEEFFSDAVETNWNGLRSKLINKEKLVVDEIIMLWQFIGLQRVRVPAARDMIESYLAHNAMVKFKDLEQSGQIPPPPVEIPDLIDKLTIAVDPQQSILAMADLLTGFLELASVTGLEVIHNETSVPLITSDNPVAIFDPTVNEKSLRPYVVSSPNGAIELLFPINPRALIRGSRGIFDRVAKRGIKHTSVKDEGYIRKVNRLSAKFAYELIIGCDSSQSGLLRTYASVSPVLQNAVGWVPRKINGPLIMAFGERPKKPKWG